LTGKTVATVTDSNRSVATWQRLVQAGANAALGALPPADRAVLTGPVRLTVGFYMPRPQKYAKRGVPVAMLTAPDWDKLARAVCDALTAVVYRDDKQIVEAVIGKFYAAVDDVPHVDIRVETTAGVVPTRIAPAPEPLPLFEAMR